MENNTEVEEIEKTPKEFVDNINNSMKEGTGSIIFEEGSRGYKAAIVIVAIFMTGSINSDEIKNVTGLSKNWVMEVKQNLRRSKCIIGKRKVSFVFSNWEDEEHGAFAFMLDCMAGSGEIVRYVANGNDKWRS